MEMIIGGAWQGKLALAKKKYPDKTFLSGADCSLEELLACEGVYGLHNFIRKEMKAGRDVSSLARILKERNPEAVIISEEVGYGVVPVDAFDRAYREAVGRICTELAADSSSVTRVVCGIGTVIKND